MQECRKQGLMPKLKWQAAIEKKITGQFIPVEDASSIHDSSHIAVWLAKTLY